MRMNIYKYILEIKEIQTIQMRKGAEILTAKMQYDKIAIWALHDHDEKDNSRTFQIVATGDVFEHSDKTKFIQSVMHRSEQVIFHIFEILE